jgi:predicted ATPase with chaperone activity
MTGDSGEVIRWAKVNGRSSEVCYLIPERFKLSARGYHRVLRVARTLADLEGSAPVKRVHIAEALSYRRLAPGR